MIGWLYFLTAAEVHMGRLEFSASKRKTRPEHTADELSVGKVLNTKETKTRAVK
jgi:hypothetical protein